MKQPRIKIFFLKKWKFDLINKDLVEYYTSISNDMLELLSVNDLWINLKHVLSTTKSIRSATFLRNVFVQ